ncbi:MAG: enoyl-CoA hydratase/isomerase family protein [Propionibacteriales bacterium]|nr:enoyl-CoA hydratase/isomerase family protein [Propionibacteriales bacterium]
MPDSVSYEVQGAVATITLDRPEAMNSLDTSTKQALLVAVRRAGADEDIRCVVVTGRGRAFSVGQDLREHDANLHLQSLEEVWSTVERHYSPIASTLAGMEKPVIAAINGIAAGAGLSIAMACDLRIAADSAGFNTAFTGVGLSCDTGASWTLPRLVGPAKAVELMLVPRTLPATEALELGLLNRVVPGVDLMATVQTLASQLAAGPTLAYASVKQAVAFAATHSFSESLTFEARLMARTGGSADHRAAVAAFMAKEKPIFEGR